MDVGRDVWGGRREEERGNSTSLWFIFNSLGALIIALPLIKSFRVSNQKVDRQIKEQCTNFLPFNYLYNTTPRAALPCLSPQTRWKTERRSNTYNSSLSNKNWRLGGGGGGYTCWHTQSCHTHTHKARRRQEFWRPGRGLQSSLLTCSELDDLNSVCQNRTQLICMFWQCQ